VSQAEQLLLLVLMTVTYSKQDVQLIGWLTD